MLIEFKIKNFLSFKDETRLLMTSVKTFKENPEAIITTKRSFNLLKTAAIFGANAAGKSNLIWAMFAMTRTIFNSFSNSLKKREDRDDAIFQFLLNSATEKANIMFELSFIIDNVIFRYGFEINDFEIRKEWLYRKVDREVPLFVREGQQFDINQEFFSEGEKYKSQVNPNVLFLSLLSQNNQPIAGQIFLFFTKINVISGLHANYQKFTAKLLRQDTNFKNWAAQVLKYLEIANIEPGDKEDDIVTIHRRYDGNNMFSEAIPMSAGLESEGTRQLIHILGPIYDTLRSGSILFIDEFGCKLHPNLTKKLIELFHQHNKNNAQIIFSSLDPTLMGSTLFRRDQIWFVEKDQFGVSSLYSLSDFSAKALRSSGSLDRKYLNNEFGAADTLEITDKITELLYEKV